MNTSPRCGRAALLLPILLGLATAGSLTGCVAPAGYGGVTYYDSDDYVYYPGYAVYYSSRHHDYIYRDHDRWVRRSAPPHGFARSAPSVPMTFHDAPARHDSEIVHTYPKTWKPQPAPAHAAEHRADHGHRKDKDHPGDQP